ncbi:ThiF family adenylyltransferase [Glutamicibacter arilaitensis]|uniref:Molybdopterin biosynthesis protein MoeB n=2 Tax=Glutamicibacter TaxID=1742989 RepID=A0A2N7RZV1_9MICC|nr:ThiF family adenylyltransferase [Glutamicibacter arilaitensis]PMQ19410.1 molybdopterin biosynthesis protein MoeB [Glutamicibacter arilaitensis]
MKSERDFPALVAPGPPLSGEQTARAARQLSLPGFDDTAQRRLAAARVLVIGAGGLGSASVPYLVGAGVGTIGIVDDDLVELSNLHRQVTHTTANIGLAKTASLAQAATALDPNVKIIEHNLRLDSSNALEIFANYDLVIDGSDNFPTRYLSNDAAQLSGIPLIWGSILQHHGQVSVAWHEHGPGYRDLFPVPPAPGTVPDCAAGGVLPGLCGTVGSLLATEALKLIAGIGTPLVGKVLIYDALAASTRTLEYSRDPQAPEISELIDYVLFCSGTLPEAEGIDAESLAELLAGTDAPVLLDVRNDDEHAQQHITGSLHLPLPELEAAIESGTELEQIPAQVTVYCARGPRSQRAASLLASRGIKTNYLEGGLPALAAVEPQLLAKPATTEGNRS